MKIDRGTRAEVNLDAIANNIHAARKNLKDSTMLCAVVKANGYGHGAVPVAKACLEAGADWLAVAILQEAVELREAGITAPILVLAQSSFEDEDGPDLYCISAHADVGVLWGTVGSAKYPNRVSVSMDGQFVNVLYGTNAILGEPPLSHITRGAITNDDRSSDVEFSACLSSADKQAAFGSSAHFDPACDAFLVQLAEPSALDRLLRLETEDGVYSVDIRTGVFEQSVVTAAEAALHRQELDRLAAQAQSSPAAECETLNLTTLSGETAARYLDVLSTTLQSHDIHPRRIWLEGVMQFAYPQDAPADDAYLLAQYEFEGETGPELFCYKNGAIAWMTRGFDPYCLNTVYDPIGNQSVAFGHSYCYDSSAISMREGHLSLSDGTVIDFQAELPLNEVLLRVGLGSPYFASAREAFLCLYGGDAAAVSVETVAGDGHIFFPQREPEVNVLTVIPLEQPAGNN